MGSLCCERGTPWKRCKQHARELAERPLSYDASLPLGQHRTGGIFIPDGTGGGTLAWVDHSGARPTLREIKKEPNRG